MTTRADSSSVPSSALIAEAYMAGADAALLAVQRDIENHLYTNTKSGNRVLMLNVLNRVRASSEYAGRLVSVEQMARQLEQLHQPQWTRGVCQHCGGENHDSATGACDFTGQQLAAAESSLAALRQGLEQIIAAMDKQAKEGEMEGNLREWTRKLSKLLEP